MKKLCIQGVILAFTLITLPGCDVLDTDSTSGNAQATNTSDLQLPQQLEVVTNED